MTLEYHQWRRLEPNTSPRVGLDSHMTCNLCKELQRRKKAGWAKKMIKSVASWWWLNTHDGECINNAEVPSWLTKFPVVRMNETYDELPRN